MYYIYPRGLKIICIIFLKGEKKMSIIKCPECNKEVSDQAEACIHCGYPLKKKEEQKPQIQYIYRNKLFGGREKVLCPKCKSYNCSYFQTVEPGVTKTSYSANLNPLKPFKLVNKKEKVIIPDRTVSKIQCNVCGKIFS